MEQFSVESTSPWSSPRSSLASNDAFNPRIAGHQLPSPKGGSLLCSDCEERFDESHFLRVGERCEKEDDVFHLMHEYKISRKVVRSNKDHGCRVCSIIDYQGSRDAETIRWYLKCHPNKKEMESLLPDVRELMIRYHNMDGDEPEQTHGYTLLYAHASAGNPAGIYVSARDIISDFRSDESFDRVKSWLTECTELHEKCNRPVAQPLPTRLIQIPTDNDMSQLLLVKSEGIKDSYIALSYAWGPGPQPNMTTSSNEDAYYKQIIFSTLPKTLQDAIIATKKLGIKYLWVDSMCIVQDSEEDKMTEIRKIRHTFKNAYCTIIGARATKSSEGFLDSPPLDYPLSAPEIAIPYGSSADGSEKGILTFRESETLEQADVLRDFTETRAWCLEESVLSPRSIIYSNIRLRWSCAETRHADGDFTYDEDNYYKVGLLPRLFHRNQKRSEEGDDEWEKDWEELWVFWKSIVRNYTTRELTRPDDKLRAISGLADEIHALYCNGDDEYLTGLWKRKLFAGLLWFIMPQTRLDGSSWVLPRIPDMAATWSWASLNGIVVHDDEGVEISPHCEIVDWYAVLSRKEPFGRAVNPCLEVRGRVKRAVWDADSCSLYDENESGDYSSRAGQLAHAFPDSEETIGMCDRVWCLELGWRISTRTSSKQILGLLLFREEKMGKRRYSRCGLFRGNDLMESWFEGIIPKTKIII